MLDIQVSDLIWVWHFNQESGIGDSDIRKIWNFNLFQGFQIFAIASNFVKLKTFSFFSVDKTKLIK